jgi:hypothetical protein
MFFQQLITDFTKWEKNRLVTLFPKLLFKMHLTLLTPDTQQVAYSAIFMVGMIFSIIGGTRLLAYCHIGTSREEKQMKMTHKQQCHT